jgi:hypothetical protein
MRLSSLVISERQAGMNDGSRGAALLIRFVTILTLGAGILAGPAVAASRAQDDPPLDLAALILHTDDLDWLFGELDLVDIEGYPYGTSQSTSHTSIDEAVSHDMYATGRGSFNFLKAGGPEAASILEETGWLRTQGEFMILPEPGYEEEQWSIGVGVSIEEYAGEEGASEALDAFGEEDLLAGITESDELTQLGTPSVADDAPAVMWEFASPRWGASGETLTLWVQVDTRIVSVAFYSAGHGLPGEEILVSLAELQIKRLEHAEYLYQPNLSSCAPRFGGDTVMDYREEYEVLNSQVFAWDLASLDDVAEEQRLIDAEGIVDAYQISQSVDNTETGAYDGTLWFAGRVLTFTDEDRAGEYLDAAGAKLEEAEYTNIEEIAGVPDLGDGAVAFTYDGADDYPATTIYVQVDAGVFRIRVGSMTEVVPETIFDLAELQLERMADGDCAEALPLPRDL